MPDLLECLQAIINITVIKSDQSLDLQVKCFTNLLWQTSADQCLLCEKMKQQGY